MRRFSSHQQGVTLISLMVGLTISLLVVLGTLAVYKSTVVNAATAGRGADTDGQRMAGMFSAQTLLQEAGFGLAAPAYGTDLVLINNAALDSDNKLTTGAPVNAPVAGGGAVVGTAVVWGSDIGAGYKCSGLLATAAGGLKRLPAVACASATAGWKAVTWTPTVLVEDSTNAQNFVVQVKRSAATSGCRVFGITGGGGLLVTLTTQNSTGLATTATTCLSNLF